MANKIKTSIVLDLSSEIGKFEQSMQSAQAIINKTLKVPADNGLTKHLSKLTSQIDTLKTTAVQASVTSQSGFKSIASDVNNVSVLAENLKSDIKELQNLTTKQKIKLLPEEEQQKINRYTKAVQTYTDKLTKANTVTDELAKSRKALAQETSKVAQQENLISGNREGLKAAKENQQQALKQLETLKKQKIAAEEAQKEITRIETLWAKAEASGQPVDKRKSFTDSNGNTTSMTKLRNTVSLGPDEQTIKDQESAYTTATAAVNKFVSNLQYAESKLVSLKANLGAAASANQRLEQSFNAKVTKESAEAFAELDSIAKAVGIDLSTMNPNASEAELASLKSSITDLINAALGPVHTALEGMNEDFENIKQPVQDATNRINESSEALAVQNEQANQVDGILNRAKAFVGLEGAARLANAALRNAFQTIKELDAQMTEMAVVTEDSVGGYWDQLPEYTERANALGVSIKSAYEAATLYYQQGLKTNEVQAVSNETLKMARIAGLSAEDATNKMTAALRGFNMEVNEANAQNIADVYSQLAAITASDVNEISSAMTKTASIASSAGMQFETTAAFLSQIIETTRESAETAGTALKTVIARFQELKKDPAEIGEVDGEIIDANKIETALRSVGVALRDTNGQFRDLDQVFLDLASKWGSLDTNTQRYIATIAAGSRQQSRFIAMMSDYQRTQQLVTAANTAAGASSKQYAKTLDSLETKLTKLKNAWDEFSLNIVDNKLIKAVVDGLTKILTLINKLTKSLGALGGALKIGIIVGSLKLGKTALDAFAKAFAKARDEAMGLSVANKTVANSVDAVTKPTRNLGEILSSMGQKMTNFASNFDSDKMTEVRNAYADLTAASKKYNDAMNATSISQAAQSAATYELGFAQDAYWQALNITGDALQDATKLTNLGFSAEETAIIIKSGYIDKLKEENLWLNKNNQELDQNTREKTVNAATEGLKKTGINQGALKGSPVGLSGLGKKLKDFNLKDSASNLGKGITEFGSGLKSLLTQIWPVIAAVGVLVATAAALYGIIKLIKRVSPEGELEVAKRRTEEAAKAATAAATAYENLSSSLDSLADKTDALADLTKGTLAWKDAVQDINAEFLALIEKYPELAKLEYNTDNGYLEFTDQDAVAQVEARYQALASSSSAAETLAKINELQKQQDVTFSELSRKAKVGLEHESQAVGNAVVGSMASTGALGGAGAGALIGGMAGVGIGSVPGALIGAGVGAVGGAITAYASGAVEAARDAIEMKQKDLTDELALMLNERTMTQEDIKTWLGDNGYVGLAAEQMAKELYNATDDLRAYGKSLQESTAQNKAYYAALGQTILSMVDDSKYSDKQKKQMETYLNETNIKRFQQNAQSLVGNGKVLKNDSDYTSYWKQLYGEDTKIRRFGRIKYTDENGKTQYVKYKDAQQQYVNAKASENLAKAVETLPQAIAKMSSTKAGTSGVALNKAINNLFNASEGAGLTAANISELKALDKADYAAMYNALDENQKALYKDAIDMQNQWEEAIKLSQDEIAATQEKLKSLNIGATLDNQLTSGIQKAYAEKLQQVAIASGDAAAVALNADMQEITKNLSEAEKQSFYTAFNALDLSKASSIEAFKTTIADLGITIDDVSMDNLIQQTIKLAAASKEVDLDSLTEQISNLALTLKKLRSGEYGFSIDDSTYQEIIKNNSDLVKDFILNIDGTYTYVGGAISRLIDTVADTTVKKLDEQMNILRDKIKAADVYTGTEFDTGEYETMSIENSKILIAKYLNSALAAGIDIANLGLGVTSSAELDNMDDSDIRSILQNIASLVSENTKATNEQKYEATAQTARVQRLTNVDAAINSSNLYKELQKAQTGTEYNANTITDISKAIALQAANAGASTTQLNTYNELNKKLDLAIQKQKTAVTGTKEYKDATQEINNYSKALMSYSRNLVNLTNSKTAREGFTSYLSEVSTAMEKFLKTSSSDIQGQMLAIQDIAVKWNITVTKDNVAYLSNAFQRLAQGNYEGYEDLYKYAEALARENGADWEDFWQFMSDAQLGFYQETEDGQTEFVTFQKDNMISMAEEAGIVAELWESPYTWLYNMTNKINANLRERNNLEWEYKQLLDENASKTELEANLQDQIATINADIVLQQSKAESAKNGLESWLNDARFSKISQYVGLGENGQLAVDKESLLKSKIYADEGEIIEDYVNELESYISTYQEAEDALRDNYELAKELANTGKEEYADLISRAVDALTSAREEQISELETINNTLNDMQSNILNKMQEQINEQREARQDAEARQDLSDKQAQLAYLQAGGGNALDIMKAQEELSDATLSYEDSLIDREIQKLQDANEDAALQREEQIEIAQAQLDYWKSNLSTKEATQLVTDAINSGNILESEFGSLLKSKDGVKNMTKEAVQAWENSLQTSSNLATIYNNGAVSIAAKAAQDNASKALEQSTKNFNELTSVKTFMENPANFKFTETELTAIKQDLNDKLAKTILGTATDAIDATVSGLEAYYAEQDDGNQEQFESSGGRSIRTDIDNDTRRKILATAIDEQRLSISNAANWQSQLKRFTDKTTGQNLGEMYTDYVAKGGTFSSLYREIPEHAKQTGYSPARQVYLSDDGQEKTADGIQYVTYNQGTTYYKKGDILFQSGQAIIPPGTLFYELKKYVTGGLADYTGPAWLDGTPSKPELVLNSTDTQNFIALKDILSDFMRTATSSNTTSNEVGANYYNIDINVDSIENDYDVEQMADKIKNLIATDAMYRNVNAVEQLH